MGSEALDIRMVDGADEQVGRTVNRTEVKTSAGSDRDGNLP